MNRIAAWGIVALVALSIAYVQWPRVEVRKVMGIVWITHDLALVAGLADRVAVMYAGAIVEEAPVRDLYRRARHPYTLGLLRSLPGIDHPASGRLSAIEGRPPDLREHFQGCPFVDRCSHAVERCREEKPRLESIGAGHASACWRRDEL